MTTKETSSPLILPSFISASPPRPPLTVPVTVVPSDFRFRICSRVWPSRPGTWPLHFPVMSAAKETSAVSDRATNRRAIAVFIGDSPCDLLDLFSGHLKAALSGRNVELDFVAGHLAIILHRELIAVEIDVSAERELIALELAIGDFAFPGLTADSAGDFRGVRLQLHRTFATLAVRGLEAHLPDSTDIAGQQQHRRRKEREHGAR